MSKKIHKTLDMKLKNAYYSSGISDFVILKCLFQIVNSIIKERRKCMSGKYNLSTLEMEIMEFIWRRERGVYFRDLMRHFVKEGGKQWKRQSLRTFLLNLVAKGALEIRKDEKLYVYVASCTKDEYIKRWTKKLLRDVYDGSLKNFLCALGGRLDMDKEDMLELREFVED